MYIIKLVCDGCAESVETRDSYKMPPQWIAFRLEEINAEGRYRLCHVCSAECAQKALLKAVLDVFGGRLESSPSDVKTWNPAQTPPK